MQACIKIQRSATTAALILKFGARQRSLVISVLQPPKPKQAPEVWPLCGGTVCTYIIFNLELLYTCISK